MQNKDLITTIVDSMRAVSNSRYSRVPTIRKVIANKPKTIVLFTDGTKSIVSLSSSDTYNLETAILYAVVKRIYGKIDSKTKEAKCPSLGNTLKKITSEMTVFAETPSKTPSKSSKRTSFFADYLKNTDFKSKVAAKLDALNSSSSKSTKYVRPNKPFSKFTQEEKRAYWRFQKSKRRK